MGWKPSEEQPWPPASEAPVLDAVTWVRGVRDQMYSETATLSADALLQEIADRAAGVIPPTEAVSGSTAPNK
ncbi:MAG: hypothetical protein IPK85_05475 [Gemmatimonadetes bacterium]|nr:hypothetical protein [Gemmatimonadota bacterium]